MKKLSYLLLIAFSLSALTGCYSNYNYSKQIRNESDVTVTASFKCCGTEKIKSFELAPGETKEIHTCIYQVMGQGPDCSESPVDITIEDEFGQELMPGITEAANWFQSKENLNVTCTFVIPGTTNTKN